MKYINGADILPPELLEILQDYAQGQYIYIPKKEETKNLRENMTEYRIELEKRNARIYTKHLEGRSNSEIAQLYHLSQPSVRRIIAESRKKFSEVKENMKKILSNWSIGGEVRQIYPTAWSIGEDHVIKIYNAGDEISLLRNIKITQMLSKTDIPVADVICTTSGEPYFSDNGKLYVVTRKLRGCNIVNIKSRDGIAHRMGEVIGRLHLAFQQCDGDIEFWNNSLLDEMNGWVKENIFKHSMISEENFDAAVEKLQSVYSELPTQIIHRDVHFGNFLFDCGEFTGYIDFDLSQRNIRIFDICYFTAGLLSGEEGKVIAVDDWLEMLRDVVAEYDSKIELSQTEKRAIPYVMENIELLFAAYFSCIDDLKCAEDAVKLFEFVQENEEKIWSVLGISR